MMRQDPSEGELFSQFVTNGQLPQLEHQRQIASSEEVDEDFLLALRLSQEQGQREHNRGDAVPDEDMDSLLLAIRLSEEEDGRTAQNVTPAGGSIQSGAVSTQSAAQHGQQNRSDYARYSFATFSRTQSQPIHALMNDPLAIAIREEFLERRSRRIGERPGQQELHGNRNSSTSSSTPGNRSSSSGTATNRANQNEQRRRSLQQRADFLLATEISNSEQVQELRSQTGRRALQQLADTDELASETSNIELSEQRVRRALLQARQQATRTFISHQQHDVQQSLRSPGRRPPGRLQTWTSAQQNINRITERAPSGRVRQNPFQVQTPTPEQTRHLAQLQSAEQQQQRSRWASQQESAVQAAVANGDSPGDCPICLEPLEGQPQLLQCGHAFHSFCISRWLEARPQCPLCRHQNPL